MLVHLVLLQPEITAMLPSYRTRLPELMPTHWAVISTLHSTVSQHRHLLIRIFIYIQMYLQPSY